MTETCIVRIPDDGTIWWAVRNGYFPNGKIAARWTEDRDQASVFDDKEARSILSRLELGERETAWRLSPGWYPIDDDAKKGRGHPVILAVRCMTDGRWVVGEAYWNAADEDAPSVRRDYETGFWWAGTAPSDYYSNPVTECTGTPVFYQPLPEAPQP